MADKFNWLDKIIEEQKGNVEIMGKVAHPYNPADLCEAVGEQDEPTTPDKTRCGICGSTTLQDLGHGRWEATVICKNPVCRAKWWKRWFTAKEWEKWINSEMEELL